MLVSIEVLAKCDYNESNGCQVIHASDLIRTCDILVHVS